MTARPLAPSLLLSAALCAVTVSAQSPPASPPLPVERLGENLLRIGTIRVDTSRREIAVAGHANQATTLEFVANTKGGMKAYESALTLDTNAVAFNAALLLIGLDGRRARVPTRHFDPVAPDGDPVEIWVEWVIPDRQQRVRIEQLLLDKRTGRTLPEGPWVYTGSSFAGGRYLADVDGVLIGFVHSPAPVIENPREGAVGAFGSVVLNPELGLVPLTPVTLTVRALDRSARAPR